MSKYNFSLSNSGLSLNFEDYSILSEIRIRVNYIRSMNVEYIPDSIESNENITTVTFKRRIERGWMWEADYVKLIFTECDNALVVKADFACRHESFAYSYTYLSYESAFIDFKLPKKTNGLLCLENEVPFWLTPSFTTDIPDFANIESLAYKTEDKHIQILPVINNKIKSQIKKNSIVINTNVPDKTEICADTFIISCGNNPFEAIETCVSAGRKLSAIKVISREDRKYPEQLEGFGWCTWNAFYKDVTSAKIYEKLEELKSKGITLKWLLVDDGWQQFADRKLLSFKEDPEKFPEGFKAFVNKVKNDYGVQYIGVWHAFGAYWDGIHKDGEIYKEHKDLLFESPTGWIFPGETEEKAFKFWDIWHSYLSSQGIDFVKVDNQTSTSSNFDNVMPGSSAIFIQHSALEKSVFKNFNGAIINCMGCEMENILARPFSAINRNSDDFFPNKEHGFILHINRNAYVAPLHNQFHYLDYDMFWTEHSESTISAVLRAISGGPVYISDEVGKTDSEALKSLVLPSGETPRMDTAAMVTSDVYYTDCSAEGTPIKVWSKSCDNIALAAFGITPDKTVSGEFTLDNIPNTADRYLVHDFFEDTYFVFDRNSAISISVDYKTCKLYTLYPISEDNTVLIGDGRYYAEAADTNPKKVSIEELI